jgi:hypothetical protein
MDFPHWPVWPAPGLSLSVGRRRRILSIFFKAKIFLFGWMQKSVQGILFFESFKEYYWAARASHEPMATLINEPMND